VAVISVERVRELRDEVGDEDFEEIVALFVAESDSLVGKLQTVGEPAEAEMLLHALKGSALNLGFDELARLCREGRGARPERPNGAGTSRICMTPTSGRRRGCPTGVTVRRRSAAARPRR
jgi:hypothetical protein